MVRERLAVFHVPPPKVVGTLNVVPSVDTSTLLMLVAPPVGVAVKERLSVAALVKPPTVGRVGVLLLKLSVGALVDRVRLKLLDSVLFPAMSVAVAV